MAAEDWIDDATFYRRVARHAGVEYVTLDPEATAEPDFAELNPLAARLLTEEVCRHFHMLPIAYRDGALCVAFSDPFDHLATRLAMSLSACDVEPVLASPGDIEQAITRIFGPLLAPRFDELGPAPRQSPRVGDLLVANGAATDAEVATALIEQQRTGSRLGEVLLHSGIIGESDLLAALSEHFKLPQLDIEGGQIDSDVVRTIPEEVARELHIVPIAADETTVYLAVADAPDSATLERLHEFTDKELVSFLSPRSQVEEILEATYRDEYLELATNDLREFLPENSAARTVTAGQKVFLVALTVAVALACVLSPRSTVIALVAFASVFYLATSLYKFRLIYKALGHPYAVETSDAELAALDERGLPVYSILVPLYKEAGVLPTLVAAIQRLDYPKTQLDVLLLCEEDDEETILAIEAMNLPAHFRLVVVPDGMPKTKPKACNYGLMLARGDLTVIYDAEDRPDPDQLKKVVLAFSKSAPEVTCVQAKLNYYNPDQNLLTRWFTIEYSMWFELLLPGLDAEDAPIPLGGTSNHFITQRLRELGAWDPYNVTEDADLGIRLHRAGWRTAMVDSTTLEEANSDLKNWIRQRSRWIKGYIQTYLVHMRNPVLLLHEAGLKGFLSFQLVVGGVFIFLLNPIFWLLTSLYFVTGADFIQAVFPTFVFYLAALMLFVGNFVFLYLNVAGAIQRGLFGLAKYALMSPIYWGLMSIAGWKGFVQLITNPFYWEKTVHGLHAAAPALAPAPAPAALRTPTSASARSAAARREPVLAASREER